VLCDHNHVYNKARESVAHRFLPIMEEEAVLLAAIQFQIEHQVEKMEYTEE